MADNNDPSLKLALDTFTLELKQLQFKIDQQEKKAAEDKKEPGSGSKVESWVKNLSLVLGIPGIIIAVFFQLSQTKNSDAQIEKTKAETQQINLNISKDKAGFILDTLLDKKQKSIEEYRTLVASATEAVNKFEKINAQRQNQSLVNKYIILWIVFSAIGIFISFFSTFWSSLVNLIMKFIYNKTSKHYESKKYKRIRNIAEYSLFFVAPLPTILDLLLRIGIFFAIMVPLFNEIAIVLGSNTDFNHVYQNIKHFEFRQSLVDIRQILFGK